MVLGNTRRLSSVQVGRERKVEGGVGDISGQGAKVERVIHKKSKIFFSTVYTVHIIGAETARGIRSHEWTESKTRLPDKEFKRQEKRKSTEEEKMRLGSGENSTAALET